MSPVCGSRCATTGLLPFGSCAICQRSAGSEPGCTIALAEPLADALAVDDSVGAGVVVASVVLGRGRGMSARPSLEALSEADVEVASFVGVSVIGGGAFMKSYVIL